MPHGFGKDTRLSLSPCVAVSRNFQPSPASRGSRTAFSCLLEFRFLRKVRALARPPTLGGQPWVLSAEIAQFSHPTDPDDAARPQLHPLLNCLPSTPDSQVQPPMLAPGGHGRGI
ncbi:hypothetical protein HGRIS_003207 [Hohenbuehelia grisea]|uniref:Uncharacterized protein n=1 Tax=Hohenbuehelia grisea TaxID=104357 RepID=A0ABR3JP83_9AGAR